MFVLGDYCHLYILIATTTTTVDIVPSSVFVPINVSTKLSYSQTVSFIIGTSSVMVIESSTVPTTSSAATVHNSIEAIPDVDPTCKIVIMTHRHAFRFLLYICIDNGHSTTMSTTTISITTIG